MTIHLLYGPVGCGKTTLAKRLERELPAVRFTHDEWMVSLHGSNPPCAGFQEEADRIWDLIWKEAARALKSGRDVVLDGGFWSRASRDDARRRAAALGAGWRLYWITCPEPVARQRVLQRTAEMQAGTLCIDGPTIDLLNRRVESLQPGEEHIVVSPSTTEV